jgi:hypothetical protein
LLAAAAAAALACHVIVSYGPAFSAVFRFLLPVGFFGFFGPLSTEAFCCCFFGLVFDWRLSSSLVVV